ncbi:TPA: ABC transporter ATP-binding protein [Clostridioides difficile]|uniref:ABC-type transport system, multidrug-family ATP-binding protein n=7 Tax=Clostridioides difficile TaxID=1496 RepID=Q186W1_CLOD6|nr:ABC transporter ATP-binding protein [Clostridioides difficile]EQF68140.1 fluoroquinolones export ATP-binding protein [Clostridioides difficile CD196]EQG60909.1 fluoroquinolones export ATP-binding protein [Clostridioides difficile DA00149]EQI37510.1 fluoroquinolones export ATP-binding protein [Clostridioides difficile Y184]EQK92310.1 fluoroquinolones export ATP-binding protein [Clostridioides difficile CD127]CCL64681.1 ABC-type transport system, multidrug-family ATP-binding protein [Clostrid
MIKVDDLSFSYTDRDFLQNINFEVGKGEILGFLGPSGAGKSTLQKILIGMITNYGGSVIVNGVESKRHSNKFYENIGVDFEFPSLYEKLTAIENLKYFGSLYSKKLLSIDELLKSVGLENESNKRVSEYSKGMKSRLNFIKALLHNPDILFLDEPTSGLDPSNSKVMKDIILSEKSKGKTIILTTHNMLDATELCDRVAFIVNGKISALDTPHNLIMSKGAIKVRYTYFDNGEKTSECFLNNTANDKNLNMLIEKNKLLSIHSSEPTLNDIFIEITGRNLQ